MTLDPDDIEQIAHRVADLMRAGQSPQDRYVDAATLAAELQVDRDWVYAHADQLGAIRLGGPRGRLRFDRQQAHGALTGKEQPAAKSVRATRRRARRSSAKAVDLIPYES